MGHGNIHLQCQSQGAKVGGSLEFASRQTTKIASSRYSKRACLQKLKWTAMEEDTYGQSLTSMCAHYWHVYTCMHYYHYTPPPPTPHSFSSYKDVRLFFNLMKMPVFNYISLFYHIFPVLTLKSK